MTNRIYKTEHLLIALFAAISLAIHLVADCNSFYHGDELLHIEAGRYPAFGYMDFAPVIAYLAYLPCTHIFFLTSTLSLALFYNNHIINII